MAVKAQFNASTLKASYTVATNKAQVVIIPDALDVVFSNITDCNKDGGACSWSENLNQIFRCSHVSDSLFHHTGGGASWDIYIDYNAGVLEASLEEGYIEGCDDFLEYGGFWGCFTPNTEVNNIPNDYTQCLNERSGSANCNGVDYSGNGGGPFDFIRQIIGTDGTADITEIEL